MTQHRDLFAALAATFDADEVKTRMQGGKQLAYVTARTVMNRLDEVLGPENWWDEFTPLENSVICKLTIRLPDGFTLAKQDAGGYAGMADKGDDDKSGFADAFKRAAVKFGVGRYLYGNGTPTFATQHAEPETAAEPPPMASPASKANLKPSDNRPHRSAAPSAEPSTGRELWRWAKNQGDAAVSRLNKLGNDYGWPARIVDWTPEIVREAMDWMLQRHPCFDTGPAISSPAYKPSSPAWRRSHA